jgi:hypothetical protein
VAALAADSGPDTALTIYSTARPGAIPPELYRPLPAGANYSQPYRGQIPGYAIVKQERPIALGKGRTTIGFTDVAAYIDPTTVTFLSLTDPKDTHAIEQNYELDLVSTDKLMAKCLDKSITLDQVQGDKMATFNGTLLSTAGGLLLKTETGVEVIRSYSNVRFPELPGPGGLITKPTLVWDVFTQQAGSHHRMRVTYETSRRLTRGRSASPSRSRKTARSRSPTPSTIGGRIALRGAVSDRSSDRTRPTRR